jgi:hypothetical protein
MLNFILVVFMVLNALLSSLGILQSWCIHLAPLLHILKFQSLRDQLDTKGRLAVHGMQ